MKDNKMYSGASPMEVKEDLKLLVDFEDEGLTLDELSSLIEERLVPHLMRYNLPGFQSMFNMVPEKGAKLGSKIALQHNQGVTNWQVSPGGAALEELCCEALCALFGFSSGADATFMYSGTYANQEAIYLALHRKAEEHGFDLGKKGIKGFSDPSLLAVITSKDAHFSVIHALRMLGLGEESIVSVDLNENFRMDLDHLKETIETCKNQEIFCVVATAGTTSTGAVDPIKPIVSFCKEIGAWLHVDGAYGLAYSLVSGWKHLFEGVTDADSVCWDPHKQMGVPIPSSVLFVRQKENFRRMTVHSHYFNISGDPRPNPGLKSPPSTRPMSALPLVATIRHLGLKKLIERLQTPLNVVKNIAEKLREYKDIEVCLSPDLGILCFRVIPEGISEEKLNYIQQYLYRRVMSEGRRTISLTELNGRTVLRLVAVSPSVTEKTLIGTIDYVRNLAKEYTRRKEKR